MIIRGVRRVTQRAFSVIADFKPLYPDSREEFDYVRKNFLDKQKGYDKEYSKHEADKWFSHSFRKQKYREKAKVDSCQGESVRQVRSQPHPFKGVVQEPEDQGRG
jgi:hypothetical protein